MRPSRVLAVLPLLAAALASCAARRTLCASAESCGGGLQCLAGACQVDAALSGTRRIVLQAADLAVLDRGEPSRGGALPAEVVLGREGRGQRLLLRFDAGLDRGANVVRASILLDRSDAPLGDDTPLFLHAERVIGRWDPRRVSWSTAPPLEDLRLPRTAVTPAGPRQVRVDVTDLVRRWLAHDRADQGLILVAENETPRGVGFALALASAADEDVDRDPGRSEAAPPRLEVYVR